MAMHTDDLSSDDDEENRNTIGRGENITEAFISITSCSLIICMHVGFRQEATMRSAVGRVWNVLLFCMVLYIRSALY